MLLSFVAGFCDTVTFIAAGELFSAHVTGNFIVFAYDLVKHANAESWQKLITFPVFILSVMIGGKIARKSRSDYTLIKLEGILLLIAGIAAIFIKNPQDQMQLSVQAIAMIIVIALAFQNTFGKLFSKTLHGLTTVMTGNVTQASLDFSKAAGTRPFEPLALADLKKQMILIGGFFLGCFFGGIMSKTFGLTAVILPGIMLIFWLIMNKQFTIRAAESIK